MNTITIEEALKKHKVTELVAYSRKSRDIDGEGLKKHQDQLQEFADSVRLPLDIREEVGSSETMNRKEMNQLRADIKNKKVKCLIVVRLDRLTRKVTDLERLMEEFKFNDLLLIEVHRGKVIDYNDTLGTKLEGIMSDLYQTQSKIVLASGRMKAVALYGNHLGEPPLGYDYNRETKKLDPNDQSFLIKRIFDMYLDGVNTHQIAIKLNQLGYTGRKGEFKGKAVWSMLHNEKYIGWQIYGKKIWWKDEHGTKHVKDRPREDWIVYEDAHEAIIDMDTWNRVQKMLKSTGRNNSNEQKRSWRFTGLIRCGKCGAKMSFTKKPSEKYYMRKCSKLDYQSGDMCNNKAPLHATIEKHINDILYGEVFPAFVKVANQLKEDKTTFRKHEADAEFKELSHRRKQIDTQLDNLIDLQLEIGVSAKLVEKQKQLQKQLEAINKAIEKLGEEKEEAVVDNQYMNSTVERMVNVMEQVNFKLNFRQGDEATKNVLLCKYFERINVTDGEITEVVFTPETQKIIELGSL